MKTKELKYIITENWEEVLSSYKLKGWKEQ